MSVEGQLGGGVGLNIGITGAAGATRVGNRWRQIGVEFDF